MNRFNTGNALPSISEEDMYDNCLSLDEAMNSTNPTWRDRFNVEKPTIDAALKSAGFMPAAFDFVTGGTLQPGDRNKAVYNPAPNGDNNWYRWNGAFPKEIAANSQPNPKNENNWVLAHFRIGIVEKEALRRTYLEAGYNLVDGSFEQGGVLVNSNDVLLQERSGKVFSGPAGTVAAGTNPESGGVGTGTWVSVGDASLRDDLSAPGGAGMVGGLPVFVTATKYAGGATTSSTSNDAAIIAAINDAIATDSYVYWPEVYEVQGNIPNFHSVDHCGPGGIKREGFIFYISPKGTTTNTIFIELAGNDSNDGLSIGFPKKTIQSAMDVLKSPYVPRMVSDGILKFKFGTGTWNDAGVFSGGLYCKNYVVFEGNVDGSNIPTTIIDGTGLTATAGMYFDTGPTLINVRNISSNNFTANSVASGFVFTNGGIEKVYTENLHTYHNHWAGINCDSIKQWVAKGGVHDGNTYYNLRARGGVAFSLGRADARITLKNNVSSVQLRDCCSGHFDYIDIINHPTNATGTGILIGNNSRITVNNCTLTNCAVGLYAFGNGTFNIQNTPMTNVPTQFRTVGNSSQECDSGLTGGEGWNYDKFFDRYSINTEDWTGSVTNNSAYAMCSNLPGAVNWSFLVANGSSSRLLFGDSSNSAAMGTFYNIPSGYISHQIGGAHKLLVNATSVSGGADNVSSSGNPSARWTQIYAVNGAINTSDAREKTSPLAIDDAILDAWGDVQLVTFQWLDSIRAKGEEFARWHFGVIAQQVRDAFVAHGLDGTHYGLLCYDEWEDVLEPVMAYRTNKETGQEEEYDTGEFKLVKEAGNRWGIRPDQCLFLEAAYQRRNYQRLLSRIEALEVK